MLAWELMLPIRMAILGRVLLIAHERGVPARADAHLHASDRDRIGTRKEGLQLRCLER